MAPVHCLWPSGLLNGSRPHLRPDLDLKEKEPPVKREYIQYWYCTCTYIHVYTSRPGGHAAPETPLDTFLFLSMQSTGSTGSAQHSHALNLNTRTGLNSEAKMCEDHDDNYFYRKRFLSKQPKSLLVLT